MTDSPTSSAPTGSTPAATATGLAGTDDGPRALEQVWTSAVEGLPDSALSPQHRAWVRLTRPLGLVEDTALLAAPNEFAKDVLDTRLRPVLVGALSAAYGREISVAVTVQPAAARGDAAPEPGAGAWPGPDQPGEQAGDRPGVDQGGERGGPREGESDAGGGTVTALRPDGADERTPARRPAGPDDDPAPYRALRPVDDARGRAPVEPARLNPKYVF
ncbi:MAG TPA: hypothetical protein VNU26_04020, partial [Mycobacteriales bacterium]|nr:hypothetical protein [Mycobacteriales bacterium]